MTIRHYYNSLPELEQNFSAFTTDIKTKTTLPDSSSVILANQTGLLHPMFLTFTKVKMSNEIIRKKIQPNTGDVSPFYNKENVYISYDSVIDAQKRTAAQYLNLGASNIDCSTNDSCGFSSHTLNSKHLGDFWLIDEAKRLGTNNVLVITEERKNLGEDLRNNNIKAYSLWDGFLYLIKIIKEFFSKDKLIYIYCKLKFETGIFIPVDVFNKFLKLFNKPYLLIKQEII